MGKNKEVNLEDLTQALLKSNKKTMKEINAFNRNSIKKSEKALGKTEKAMKKSIAKLLGK